MRPRQFASENEFTEWHRVAVFGSFNEAEAICLGKYLRPASTLPFTNSFNEAEAICLGKLVGIKSRPLNYEVQHP